MSTIQTPGQYVDALRLTDRQWQAILSDVANDARYPTHTRLGPNL